MTGRLPGNAHREGLRVGGILQVSAGHRKSRQAEGDFTQVRGPREVKPVRPACLSFDYRCRCVYNGVVLAVGKSARVVRMREVERDLERPLPTFI